MDLWLEQGAQDAGFAHSIFSTAALACSKLYRHEHALTIEAKTPPQANSSELQYVLGTCYAALGRNAEAIEHLNKAWQDPTLLKRGGSDPSTATWRPLQAVAELYAAQNRLDEAYDALTEALKYAPGRADIMFTMAEVAVKAVHKEVSVEWLRKIVAGDQDAGFHARARRAMLDLANATGDSQLALESFSGEIEGMNGIDSALIEARVYEHVGNQQGQREALERAHSKFPEDQRISMALARLLVSMGLYKESADLLSKPQATPQPKPQASFLTIQK
jgi:tetratricopeptide (TPR) repeat protein